jgi:hypothetical protein
MARKSQKELWIDRRCCDWDMFLFELIGTAYQIKFPLLLVNWCQARRYWRRYSYTGAEVIKIQCAREISKAMYSGFGEPSIHDERLGDGSGSITPSLWWRGSID